MNDEITLLVSVLAASAMRLGYLAKQRKTPTRSELFGHLTTIGAFGFVACALLQWKVDPLPWQIYTSAALAVGYIGETKAVGAFRRFFKGRTDLAPIFEGE